MAQQQVAAKVFLSHSSKDARLAKALAKDFFTNDIADKLHELVCDACFLVDQAVASAEALPTIQGDVGNPKRHVLRQLQAHIAAKLLEG